MSVRPIDSGRRSVSKLRRLEQDAWEAHKAARIGRCQAEIAYLRAPSDKTLKRLTAAESEDASARRAFTKASRELKEAQEVAAAA